MSVGSVKNAESSGKVALETLGLFLLAIIAMNPAIQGGFVWDDDTHITANAVIGPNGLFKTWFTTTQPNYWPITWTAFWAEWKLFGNTATGYHVVSVLEHAICSLLLWRVLLSLCVPGAWLAAALFSVHTVNVEAVAWITQQKTLLSALFGWLSAWLFLLHDDGKGRRFMVLSVVAFLLSLLSKPASVMLPFVFLGFAWWKRDRLQLRDLRNVAPFFLLSAGFGLLEIWFQTHRSIGDYVVRTDGFAARLAGAGWVAWFYAWKAVFPVKLAFVYPRWNIDPHAPLSYLPTLGLILIFGLLWVRRSSWGKPFLAGFGYFVLNLIPVMGFANIFYMRYSYVADHYQYVALPGVVATVAGVVTLRVSGRGLAVRRLIRILCGAVVVALACESFTRSGDYHDADTLWRAAIRDNPQSWMAHCGLGASLLAKGKIDEAEYHLQQSAKINPEYYDAQLNLGTVMLRRGKFADAAVHFEKLKRSNPDGAGLAISLAGTYLKLGRKAEARKLLDEHLSKFPRDLKARLLMQVAQQNGYSVPPP